MWYVPEQLELISEIKRQIDLIEKLEIDEILETPRDKNTDYRDVMELYRRCRQIILSLRQCEFDDTPVHFLRTQLFEHLVSFMKIAMQLLAANVRENVNWNADILAIRPDIFSWHEHNYQIFVDAALRATSRQKGEILMARAFEQLDRLEASSEFIESRQKVSSQWLESQQTVLTRWEEQRDLKIAEHEKKYLSLIDQVHSKLGEIGSSHHAVKFRKEARWQFCESFLWLSLAILAGGFVIGYAIWLEVDLKGLVEGGAQSIWPLLALRGVVVSVVSVFLFVCIRSYSACRHNVIVNRHRENALSTFITFSDGAHDLATKNAVLLEATKAVFSAAPSGYLKAANEGNPTTHIIEMFRNQSSKLDD